MEKGQKNARTDKIADWPFSLHFFPFFGATIYTSLSHSNVWFMKHKKSRSLVINKYGKSLENSVKLLKSINSWLVFYIIMKWSYHQNEVYPLIFVTAPHSNKEDKISFFNTLISSYRIQGTKLIDVKFNRSLIQTKKGSYPIHKSPTFAGSGRGDW